MTSPLPNRRWAVAVEVYATAPWKPRPAPFRAEDARDRDDLAAAGRRQRDRVARRQVEVVRDPAGEHDLVRLWRRQRPVEQVERSEVLGAVEVGADHVQDVVSGDDGRSRPLRHGPGGAAERHRPDGRLDPVEGGHLVDECGREGGVVGPDRPDEHVDVPGRPGHGVVEGGRGRGAREQHGVEHGHPERRAGTRQREPRRSPALGVAVLYAVLLTGAATTAALDDAVSGSAGDVDVFVGPVGSYDATLPPALVDQVAALDGVETAVGSVTFRSSAWPVTEGTAPPVVSRDNILYIIGRAAE